MLPASSSPNPPTPNSIAALVVEPDPAFRFHSVQALIQAGFSVNATDRFEPARRWIAEKPPAVLVTALKLGEYNGLHLVLRARVASPQTAALVTNADLMLDLSKEVCEAGAAYILLPVAAPDLVACALRMLFRRSPSERVEPPFERRLVDRRNQGAAHFPDRRIGERRRDFVSLMQALPLS